MSRYDELMDRYDELMDKYLENDTLTEEESNEIITLLGEKVKQSGALSSGDVDFLFEYGNYEQGDLLEVNKDWVLTEYIFHINGKHYLCELWHNDYNELEDFGITYLKEVEMKEVKVMKWMPVGEDND